MSSNLIIVPRNFHDEATLSVEFPSVVGFPASNTQNRIRSRVWMATDGTDQSIYGTYADNLSRTASYFGMFRHLCQGGNVRLRLYTDASWTSLIFDSSANPVINVVVIDGIDWGIAPYSGGGTIDPFLLEAPYWLYFSPTAHLSYRITFTGNVTTYGTPFWQVCRLVLGNFFQVNINPSYGHTIGFVDQTDSNRSRGGTLRTNIGPTWKTMQMQLDAVEESERAGWLDIMRYVGTSRDFVTALFVGENSRRERDHHILGLFSNLDALGRQVNRLTKKFQIQEG